MARDIDLERLGLKLKPKHTKRLCRLGKLQRSLVERIQIMAWVEIEFSGELEVHPMEEENEKLRQPSHHKHPSRSIMSSLWWHIIYKKR